jgi:hypothetical protein
MREHILDEIQRIANERGGAPPGRRLFEQETGILTSEWSGIYWARWSDAVSEAGFKPNERQVKLPSDYVLGKYAEACRHFGKVPTNIELRMYAKQTPDFLSHNTFGKHFGNKENLIEALRAWAQSTDNNEDLLALLPAPRPRTALVKKPSDSKSAVVEGLVYLLKSGDHYKIGRSSEIERRIKQISISLPEQVTLVHAIRTDDPPGIEAYWHRRFAEQRAKGEWFKLKPSDIKAFKRRKSQ